MTPQKEKALSEHMTAVQPHSLRETAKILYEDTSPSELNSLESIETVVREKLLTHVSPQIGFFLSKKSQKQSPEDLEL
jgi:hypothetical protein